MSAAFDKALAFTLGIEGGYSNRLADRGGVTNHGITQKTYDGWRKQHGMRTQSVTLMGEQEERAIYYETFWVPCRCEELGAPIGAAVFDFAVNSGPWNAKLVLQAVVHVRQDGVIGDATLAAARTTTDLLLRYLQARGAFLRDDLIAHPSDVANIHGWINRLLALQDAAHKGAFA